MPALTIYLYLCACNDIFGHLVASKIVIKPSIFKFIATISVVKNGLCS